MVQVCTKITLLEHSSSNRNLLFQGADFQVPFHDLWLEGWITLVDSNDMRYAVKSRLDIGWTLGVKKKNMGSNFPGWFLSSLGLTSSLIHFQSWELVFFLVLLLFH